jgi:alkylation response protein AidB-like acyl-CoA dehydrogenase
LSEEKIMRWELSDQQRDFQSVLRDWLTEHCTGPAVRARLDDPAPFESEFSAAGWFAVGSTEEVGGQGGGLVDLALIAEELGRRAAPSSAWLGSMVAMPAFPPEVAKAVLNDDIITVLAIPADSVPRSREVFGAVAGVLAADRARRLVVPVRDSLTLVEADDVDVHPRLLTDRTRTVADVVIPAGLGTSLGVPAGPALEAAALRAAVLTAADALGVAEQLLDMTVEYSKQRHQFGVPIGSFQAVKHAAAELLVHVEAARSIVYLAAASVDAGHPAAHLHAAAAKAQVTESAAEAADVALSLHGAIGYTWEHDLQLYYKRAKLTRRLFGSPQAWNERLATALAL